MGLYKLGNTDMGYCLLPHTLLSTATYYPMDRYSMLALASRFPVYRQLNEPTNHVYSILYKGLLLMSRRIVWVVLGFRTHYSEIASYSI